MSQKDTKPSGPYRTICSDGYWPDTVFEIVRDEATIYILKEDIFTWSCTFLSDDRDMEWVLDSLDAAVGIAASALNVAGSGYRDSNIEEIMRQIKGEGS